MYSNLNEIIGKAFEEHPSDLTYGVPAIPR